MFYDFLGVTFAIIVGKYFQVIYCTDLFRELQTEAR